MTKSAAATMQRKGSRGLGFKILDDSVGSFRAVFSTFNVVDLDGDVTRPDAFTRGQPVRIMQYGHQWGDLPVGKGTIDFDKDQAWVDGKFFLDTAAGLEHYKTIKNMDDLQEWSYGFNVLQRSEGEFEQDGVVNFLEKLDVFEVSPVMLGAGVGTRTEVIKGHDSSEEPVTFDSVKASLTTVLGELKSDTDLLSVALGELRALIEEHTPKPPEPKVRMHHLAAELSEARANSQALRRQPA